MYMKKALIFDLDGTLWDARSTIVKAWNDIFKKNHIENRINVSDLSNIMGCTPKEIEKLLFPEMPYIYDMCEKNEITYILNIGGNIYDNVIDSLYELNKSFDLYIVSNCQKGYIEAFLKHYNISRLFKDIECSGNTGLEKDKNIRLIIERNAIDDAIYIGDTNNDYIASKNNNIDFIFAKYGFGEVNCEKYIESFSELKTKVMN